MKILIVFAHPDSRSLSAALRDVAVEELKAQGYEVQISDLYAMHWKPAVDREDFPSLSGGERLNVMAASGEAFSRGILTDDVRSEQEKLAWADALIVQFPLWWFSMPAILKGWFDRVYSHGFAYGVGEHSESHWGDRYGEGSMVGKRAMLLVTTGGWEEHYSARGINGPIDHVLFPINHGLLFYPGFDVLPPLVAHKVGRLDEAGFASIAERLRERMRTLATTRPIPYRRQNGGDYLIPSLQLRPDLGEPVASGFALHLNGSVVEDEKYHFINTSTPAKSKSSLKGVRMLHSEIQKEIVEIQSEAESFTLRHAALLTFVMASGFLIVSQIYMIIPLANDIVARFDVTPARAALVSSVFAFAYAVGFLVFGPLSDRLGRKRVLVCGLIVTALATCIVAVMPSFGLLLVARAFQGFASSAFPPAALSSITEELPEQYRPFGVSLISFAFLGAAPLAQFVAAQLPGGLSTIMFQFVPLYLIGAAGLFFTLRSPRNYDSAKNTGMRAGKTSLFRDAGTVAAWMAAGTVLFGFVTFHAGAQALGPGINVDLQTLRLAGLPPLLFTFAAALVTRRYGAPATALLGLTVAAIALIVATIATPNIIIAASVILSAGVAFAVPGLIATVSAHATNTNRGLSLAIYTFLLFIGASIAPPVAQSLAQFGPMPVWLLPAALFAVGALGLALSGFLQKHPSDADEN